MSRKRVATTRPTKRPDVWWHFIIDHDAKVFWNRGLVSTEVEWNQRVLKAMERGRKLQTAGPWTKEEMVLAEQHYLKQGYSAVNFIDLDGVPKQENRFSGVLPDYAANADRTRIVKLLCHRCNTTRFAEMDEEFPGIDKLRQSDIGSYKACCLKCGCIASDSYNWMR